MFPSSSLVEVATAMRETFDHVPGPDHGLGGHLGEEIRALRLLMDRVEAVYLERLAAFDSTGAAACDGSLSTGSWLSHQCRMSARKANTDVSVARRLHTDTDRRLPKVAHALATGDLSVEHVHAIVRGTAHIPIDRIAQAEATLVEISRDLNAGLTNRAAQRIHQLLKPQDAFDRREWARGQRNLDLVATFEGMWWIQGLLNPEDGAALAAVLEPMSAPVDVDAQEDPRSPGARRADAIGELARWAASAGAPPIQGGLRPHLALRVDLDSLADGLADGRHREAHVGRATSETRSGPISMWATRMIACDASVSLIVGRRPKSTPRVATHDSDIRGLVDELLSEFAPAIGGIPWDVLDVGRATRLVTPGQRAALNARDKGCVYPGCDRPPEWTDAHHIIHWADGGATNLDNLALLCQRHHTIVHQQELTLIRRPDGHFDTQPRAPDLHDTG